MPWTSDFIHSAPLCASAEPRSVAPFSCAGTGSFSIGTDCHVEIFGFFWGGGGCLGIFGNGETGVRLRTSSLGVPLPKPRSRSSSSETDSRSDLEKKKKKKKSLTRSDCKTILDFYISKFDFRATGVLRQLFINPIENVWP